MKQTEQQTTSSADDDAAQDGADVGQDRDQDRQDNQPESMSLSEPSLATAKKREDSDPTNDGPVLDDPAKQPDDPDTNPVDMLGMTASTATIKPSYAQAHAELVVPERPETLAPGSDVPTTPRSRNLNNLCLTPAPYVDPTPPTPPFDSLPEPEPIPLRGR